MRWLEIWGRRKRTTREFCFTFYLRRDVSWWSESRGAEGTCGQHKTSEQTLTMHSERALVEIKPAAQQIVCLRRLSESRRTTAGLLVASPGSTGRSHKWTSRRVGSNCTPWGRFLQKKMLHVYGWQRSVAHALSQFVSLNNMFKHRVDFIEAKYRVDTDVYGHVFKCQLRGINANSIMCISIFSL